MSSAPEQLSSIVFGVAFDIHQVKLGSALQKTVPLGLAISSFFEELAVFGGNSWF